jgi:hypothetical protein
MYSLAASSTSQIVLQGMKCFIFVSEWNAIEAKAKDVVGKKEMYG